MMSHRPARLWIKRLDRLLGEVNAWLLVVAVGLAILDLAVLATLGLTSQAAVGDVPACVGSDSCGPRLPADKVSKP